MGKIINIIYSSKLCRSPTDDAAYVPAAKRQTTSSRWSGISNDSRMSMSSNYSIDSWHQLRPDGRPSIVPQEERRAPFTPTRAVSATPGYTPKPMYTPQFKPSTARFSSGALIPLRSITSESHDNEGNKWNTPMSSIQRRRMQRASMSAGATVRPSGTSSVVAKRILDTLGELTSSLDEQRQKPKTANLAMMKPIPSGPSIAAVEKPTTSIELASSAPPVVNQKPEPKVVSFAETTPVSKKSSFHAKPTPRPRIVDSEFTFDSPKPIAGLDIEELEPEESSGKIKFTFSPACKSTTAEKRRKSLDAKRRQSLESADSTTTPIPSPVAAVKSPIKSVAETVLPTPAASTAPAVEPEKKGFNESIWKRPNSVKCEVCLVQNDQSATKCVACESPLGSSSAATAAPVAGPPKLPSWAASSASTPAATPSTAAPASSAASSSGFVFGASASTAPAPSSASFSFGTPSTSSVPSAATSTGFSFEAPSSATPAAVSSTTSASTLTAASGFVFGASTAASKAEASETVKPVSFSFGATAPPSATPTASVPTSVSTPAPLSFSFGETTSAVKPAAAVSEISNKTPASFGATITTEPSSKPPASTSSSFGATITTEPSSKPPASTPSFTFGAASTTASDAKASVVSTPSFGFGADAGTSVVAAPASTAPAVSFTFGASSSAATSATTTTNTTAAKAAAADVFGSATATTKPPLAQPSSGFAFGATSSTAVDSKPKGEGSFQGFGFSASPSTTSVPVPPLTTGDDENKKKKRSSEDDNGAAEKRGVSFGGTAGGFGTFTSAAPAASSGFQFGKSAEPSSASSSLSNTFGAPTTGSAPFNFLPKKDAKPEESSAKLPTFGVSTSAAPATSSGGFVFGASAPSAPASAAPSIGPFGSTSSAQASKPFGSSTSTATSGFSFSAASSASTSVPAMSFQFNKTTSAAPSTPAAPSSFTFGGTSSIGNESPNSAVMDTGDGSNMSVVNLPSSSQGTSFGFSSAPQSSSSGMFGGIASNSAPFGNSAPSFGGSTFGSGSAMPFGSSAPATSAALPSGPFGASSFNSPAPTSFNTMSSGMGGGMSMNSGMGGNASFGGDSVGGFNLGAGDSNKATAGRRKVKAKRPQ